jgi:hypothetical protein
MRAFLLRWTRRWMKPVASRPIGTVSTIEGKRRSSSNYVKNAE